MSGDEQHSAWGEWDKVMRSVLRFMQEENFIAALKMIDGFSVPEGDNELQSSILGVRAQVKEDLGDLQGARADLISAISLVGPSFAKYVNETILGELCRKQGQHDEAISWYRAALRICTESHFPGGRALKKLLELQPPETFSEEDRNLWIRVAQISWDLLALPGHPDFANFRMVASTIVAREARSAG